MAQDTLQSLYARLPIRAQEVFVSAAGWLSYRARYGAPFQRVLNELRQTDRMDEDQLRADQDRRLREIVRWAATLRSQGVGSAKRRCTNLALDRHCPMALWPQAAIPGISSGFQVAPVRGPRWRLRLVSAPPLSARIQPVRCVFQPPIAAWSV